jgi:C4-type Zn-finger protein
MSRKAKRKRMRSGTEECPICDIVAKLCRHHINGREVPRAEEEWNISWICPNCHDKIHEGDIIIEGWFKTTNGRKLIWRDKEDDSITGEESSPPKYS